MYTKPRFARYLPGLLLLAAAVLVALLTYQDFGISWDEQVQRKMGEVSYDYIFKGDKALDTYIERDHGVGFELVLLLVEKAVDAKDFRDVFLTRHLATHVFFLLGAFAGYVLALRLFNKQWLAVLAFLMIVVNPRLYAHSFFNSKDIPLLSAYLISLLLAELSFRSNKLYAFLLLGLSCGYATSIRILGIYIIVCLIALIVIDIVIKRKAENWVNGGKRLCTFLIGAFAGVYMFWPTLWANPFKNFIEAYQSLSHFRWLGNVLFYGTRYESIKLPWFYLPGWFVITTPILWLSFALIGFIFILLRFARQPQAFLEKAHSRNFILYLLCFFGPVAAVIILKSVVYDDWRHVYFVYPSFVMIALYGLNQISGRKVVKLTVITFAVGQLVLLLGWMIQNHPLHEVYFNEFVSAKEEYRRKNFDYDYWGSGYKQALEYLAEHDTRDEIKLFSHQDPIMLNVLFLPEQHRKRIKPVKLEEAEYYPVNFRDHPGDYEYADIFYNLRVDNSSVIRIYKIK
ncbi:MAG TPA: glycosyltransferase family 39 protein [Flavipsychrobacter sp.]|nr:glycosyltransferase family 39 protein [Flavipsychrobacter sp.]